ncbi:MAG: nucleotidyltransferase family protein [Gammaproteobacteria bacterium]
MTEEEFSNIFIGPLHEDGLHLSEIDKNIYDEVIDLTNRFCMPSQVLNNLVYNNEVTNPLIDSLLKQRHVANLKTLINRNELLKIANLFNENSIDYVFMKGAAINELNDDYVRHSRDLDILVCKQSLSKAYGLLKGIGYFYLNPLVSDSAKFISQKHHLPVLTNGEGALVEIHHRVTKKMIYKECPLTHSMLRNYLTVTRNKINFRISDVNHTIAHIIYHAIKHHKFNIGPIFLHDIKSIRDQCKDEEKLNNLLDTLDLKDDYRKILNFIDTKSIKDSFEIYNTQQLKIVLDEINLKKLSNLPFTQKGRINFWNIMKTPFQYSEDSFQTSKYSFKFYLMILKTLKRHIERLLRN